MDSAIQEGYLVLADLSGYTSFLAENELDHSQAILQGVLTLLVDHLTPTMTLAEVEGDAVFVYAPASRLGRGELLLELVEATYAAFRDRQRTMVHNATCPCRACRSIATLDLKFVAHFGPFVLQDLAGRTKPVGSCVNLAHRLLKNGVAEATGWHGYALFSEACLERMGFEPEQAHRAEEAYEHLGAVRTSSLDLDAPYRAALACRHVELAEEDADVVVRAELPVPPPVAWDWLSDVHKRAQWMKGADWQSEDRPGGRTGTRATNHCVASGFIEHVLDWRPFDYYTVRYTRGSLHFLISARLTPSEAGTHVRWLRRGEAGLPRWVRRPATRLLASRLMKVGESFETLARLAS